MKSLLPKLWNILNLSTNLQLFFMRMFNDQFLVGVTGIFFNDKNEILLFKHTYRGKDRWSLPGGYVKGREHPKEALEREVREESELIVSADEKLKIRTDRETARLDITYSGIFIGGEFSSSNEVKEAGFFSFNTLPLLPKDQLIFIEKAILNRKVNP